MSKFIHHERFTSDWMTEEQGFDVVEDSDGFKVYEGSMVVAECGTLNEACEEAKSLLAEADEFHTADEEQRKFRESLPPDPDSMNDARAGFALAAVRKFQDVTGTDDCDAFADLIGNLFHLADRHPEFGDVRKAMEKASRMYAAETHPEGADA